MPIPDPIYSGLGCMQYSTDGGCSRDIRSWCCGFRWVVPAPTGVARVRRTANPTRAEGGTVARTVEGYGVPGRFHVASCAKVLPNCQLVKNVQTNVFEVIFSLQVGGNFGHQIWVAF